MSISNPIIDTGQSIKSPGLSFLAFLIGEDKYMLDIFLIHEIKTYTSLNIKTPFHALPFFKGVCKINHQIVPIIDLRVFFNFSASRPSENLSYSSSTVVLLINIDRKIFGFIVDSVIDIISFTADEITQAPLQYRASYVEDVGYKNDEIYLILETKKLITDEKISMAFSGIDGQDAQKPTES